MAYTDTTPHLKLPLYSSDDRPSILTDFNPMTVKIDEAYANLSADNLSKQIVIDSINAALNEIKEQITKVQDNAKTLEHRLNKDEVQIAQNAAAIANIHKQLNEKE